jgi:hypothetical protein
MLGESFALLDNITISVRVVWSFAGFEVFLLMLGMRYVKQEPSEYCSIQQAAVCYHALERCIGGRQKLFPGSEAST